MKKILLLLLLSVHLSALAVHVKIGRYDAMSQSALVQYTKTAKGTWSAVSNVPVSTVEGEAYAFDSKNNKLYIKNEHGNYVVEFDKRNAQIYKNNKSIAQLNGMQLQTAIGEVSNALNRYHNDLTVKRQQAIADSVAREVRLQEEARQRQMEEERREQERRYAAEMARRMAEEAGRLPVGNRTLTCKHCDHVERCNPDMYNVVAVTPTEIYQIETHHAALGTEFKRMHTYAITDELRTYAPFNEHVGKYGSYLAGEQYTLSPQGVKDFNRAEGLEQVQRLRAITPYGFLSNMEIDCTQGVTVSFTFTNVNNSTVKQLELAIDYMNEDLEEQYGTMTFSGPIEKFAEADFKQKFKDVRGCPGNPPEIAVTLTIHYQDGTTVTLSDEQLYIDEPEK